ncbi:hypothetical protein EMIT0210MI2_250063 [Priestia megaterium]
MDSIRDRHIIQWRQSLYKGTGYIGNVFFYLDKIILIIN